jgi:hypothetical protein
MSSTLTPAQQIHVNRARELAALPVGDRAEIADYLLVTPADDSAQVYARAWGAAQATVRNLLAIIADLTDGQS